MSTDYAAVEIQDALLKMSLYFNLLSAKSTSERPKLFLNLTKTSSSPNNHLKSLKV